MSKANIKTIHSPTTSEASQSSEPLSARDLRLSRYVDLNDKIKAMTTELNLLKDEIKHMGSYSTKNFVAIVETSTQTRAPGTKKLLEIYGPSAAEHFTTGDVTRVKVSRKGGV